jgi:plasmid stability protein
MHQLTLRIPEELGERLKRAAASQGRSVNSFATAVLGAAVDPELGGDETVRVRERLARAGLLVDLAPRGGRRPSDEELSGARARAAREPALSDLVSEGRR